MEEQRLSALRQELVALGVPAGYYSVGSNRDERTCLVLDDGKWLVYFSERGQLADLAVFDSFEAARGEFVRRLVT